MTAAAKTLTTKPRTGKAAAPVDEKTVSTWVGRKLGGEAQ